ncbi:MAG: ATP-binding protein [Planctomycetaceae bacterium]|jgi:NADPH-dependent 7-cyano-7-deazaguanine reductase QueF-like protein|nr:ATP-binding protein [Planctomycetaceae bacterium]
MKKLAIDTQSFEKLRSRQCLYVDKTEFIYRMITEGSVYFLSRPRRFGKSLLVSTLEVLFRGKKDLFDGLYIYDKWEWDEYPVITIDWTAINHSTPEKMEESIVLYLKGIAQNYQITLEAQSAVDYFRDLIEALQKKIGKNVAVLIDEYDKPITAHLVDEHLEEIKIALHDFYQVMKGTDKYLQFVLLIGVSKFSGLSVFSALNNPQDITLRKEYAAICGYTQEELENNFSEYIDCTAEYYRTTREDLLDKIRYWYNGYTWDGKTAIYNPLSTMKFFQIQEFDNYWFSTATPTFLINLIQRRNRVDLALNPVVVDSSIFKGYDTDKISEVPLLFQTGYLTIKKMEMTPERTVEYTLDVPNMEVNKSLLTHLLQSYGKYSDDEFYEIRKTMQQQISNCDEAGLAGNLEKMIANVPYDIHIKHEHYYHSLMMLWLSMLGFKVRAEEHNNLGRSDAVWEQSGFTVVAEIKYHAAKKINTLLNEAMKLMHEKRYYNKYTGKVLLLAVAFSGKNTGCRIEVLKNKG